MKKNNFSLKLILIIKTIIIYMLICFNAYSDNIDLKDDFVLLGKPDAPIKIRVFSSLTCPHCANFHINVIPKLKETYIEKGILQIMLMDFPLDQAGFNASKLIYCLDNEKRILYLDKIYENQNKWTSGTSIVEINNNLKKIAETFGLNSGQFDKCIADETVSDRILNSRIDGQKKYSIDSTPTIIINEKKLKGSADFKNIKNKIEKLI